ncbi:uncharacterized protein LOC62_04G005299 [Vanrija pseudolonga]|uniref:Uncharacterized protein n=1 Tax=Vanrija pseudolonga TaxID=143232 RepID=A0AAF1BR67_9TREE|nr:hypothetical protein LOC62_04G005299 [Vanrija pseudolonga]
MLDHTAFPLVIDLILYHAAPNTLAAFSATCKAYRDKLRHQLRHVSLATEGYLCPVNPGTLTPPALPMVPGLVDALDVAQSTLHAPAIRAALDAGIADDFDLRYLRRIGAPTSAGVNFHLATHADTLVHFLDLDEWDFPLLDTGYAVVDMDLGMSRTRHVIHLRWCDDRPLVPGDPRALGLVTFNFACLDEGYEYVFVLHPYSTTGQAHPHSARALLLSILWAAIHDDMGPEFEASITIVGLEATDLSALEVEGSVERVDDGVPDMFRPFAATFEYYIDETDADDEESNLDIFRRSTRYFTMEDWRAKLDDEDRELIAEWVEATP